MIPSVLYLIFACSTIAKVHVPHRISYKYLLKNDISTQHTLLEALSEVGLISITEIPSYEESKKNTLDWMLHECSQDSESSKIFKYQDGTVRRTLATHTVPGPGGMQRIKHNADGSKACTSFSKSSFDMRTIINQVTKDFASALSSILDIKTPIMETKDGYPFKEFRDVVENGEHLEHFHSYQNHGSEDVRDMDTIETHTDQGVFIAFTPGKIVNKDDSTSTISDGFFVELQDGSHAMVDLNEKDLVFMLGDGVQQYINPKISSEGRKLRATPHFLRAPSHNENEARVWYGRMVLPPALAYIPSHDMTYDQVRKLTAENNHNSDGIHLGCSSSQIVRYLESDGNENECAEGSIYCWSRCMSHTEYVEGISPEVCQERNLELKCVNPRGQVYIEGHGDFYADCTNSTEPVTSFPPLPGHPTDESICTEEDWQDFSTDKTFDHCKAIGENNKANLCWSIDGEFIDARLSYNGLFGYISLGFNKPDGGLNGMLGASVIMALPGDDFNPIDGLDLTMDPTVQEYIISPGYTRFRHWGGPVPGRNTSAYDSESTACFSAMTFTSDSINEIPFNVTGTDYMLWAANGKDYYIEYHGGDQRDNFYIEWSTGKIWQGEHDHAIHEDEDEVDHSSHEDHGQEGESSAPLKSYASSFFMALLLLVSGIVM